MQNRSATGGSQAADGAPDADRRKRSWLRSQTMQQQIDRQEREDRKTKRKTAAADLADSIKIMSPFLCLDPQPSKESRVQWALEWTELGALKKLPPSFDAATLDEVTTFLNNYKTNDELFAYFGLIASHFYKYQAQVRKAKESKNRVAKLAEEPVRCQRLRLQMRCAHSSKQVRQQQSAGSSAAHAAEIVIELSGSEQPVVHDLNLQFKHSGRQVVFSEETIAAAKDEFKKRVTGPKRGMCAEAMVEMLIRLRQQHQAQPFEVLPWPSEKTIMSAIDQLEAEGLKAHFTNPSRARALEDWRNAINCAAMWWAINDCGIDKSLQFSIDEVSVLLEAGRKPRMMYFPKGMAKACRRRNLAPAAVAVDPKKRMAHLLCMTNAEGDLAATVVKIADHTVAAGKIFLKFVSKGLWVAFVNPSVPKPQYSRAILLNCLLPTVHQRQKDAAVHLDGTSSAADVHGNPNLKHPSGHRAAASSQPPRSQQLEQDLLSQLSQVSQSNPHPSPGTRSQTSQQQPQGARFTQPRSQPSVTSQSTQPEGIRLSQFSGEFFKADIAHANLPRAVVTFDGAHEQIESVLSADVAEWCIEHGIALFKWAAACSLVQQPNDVSRCHKILHRLFASAKYLYQPVKRENIRTCMLPVIAMLNSLPKLAKDSRLTFTKFFCNLHDILHDAFRPEVVRRGWADAGIYPFNVEQIMSGWNHGAMQQNKSWQMLEPEYKKFCLIAIEKLRDPARSGQLLDALIENVIVRDAQPGQIALTLVQAMTLAEAGDPDYMKVQITGIDANYSFSALVRVICAQIRLPQTITGACI
jgi:hypothetical protein